VINISIPQALDVWADLEEALRGENSFGGNVAEIYAYRLQVYDPSVRGGMLKDTSYGREAQIQQSRDAGRALVALLLYFCERRNAVAFIETPVHGFVPLEQVAEDLNIAGFDHRIHVRLEKAAAK
jgi:hypothetical protein